MITKINKIFAACFVCFGMSAALTACSNDDITGDPDRNWANTTDSFVPTDEKGFSTFYTPAIGRVGDPMPFYDPRTGAFKVLYLQEFTNNLSYRYHPIWAVATADGCNYESLGEVLPVGTNDYQQDAALGTGCCYYNDKDGLYYLYYTGHNPNSKYTEAVMRATSADFKNWTRDELWQLNGPAYGYSSVDFRDPQIFVADDGLYHMVIATRPVNGGDPKFAEFKSSDMRNWEHIGHFNMVWDRMLECPDIFKMGDWWYLVYSESYKASWSRKVKYMMATTYEGLKACFNDPGANWPKDGREGVLDSRGLYAGKTAANGAARFLWGWCPYRDGGSIHEKNVNVGAGDGNEPNWSGALVCHQVIQHEDGTLTLGAVPGLNGKYGQSQAVNIMGSNGFANGTLTGDDAYILFNRLGYHNHLSLTVTTSNNWDKFGISLVRGGNSSQYYTMVFNPENENWRKINFEQEGNEGKGFVEGIDSYGFERPADNTYHIDIYTDNSVMVMYVNGNVCYTNRIYGIQKNC